MYNKEDWDIQASFLCKPFTLQVLLYKKLAVWDRPFPKPSDTHLHGHHSPALCPRRVFFSSTVTAKPPVIITVYAMFKILVSHALLGNFNEINGDTLSSHLFSSHATQFSPKMRIYGEEITNHWKYFCMFFCCYLRAKRSCHACNMEPEIQGFFLI